MKKPWELGEDDGGVFREPSKKEIKERKRKDYNEKQKRFAKLLGENLASYACVLIVVLMIGFIWTDLGISISWPSLLADSLISVVLFVVAEYLTSTMGTDGGRLDDVYVRIHNEYLDLRKTVMTAGISLMDKFCDWQVDVEYEYYIRKKCKEYKIKYDDYVNTYSEMSVLELQKVLPKKKAAYVAALNNASHIELTPDMLLTDGKVRGERGGLPICGEEYVEKHTTGGRHVTITAITAILTAIPVFTLTQDVSLGRIIYTIFKLAMLFYRMYNGFSRGAKAFNTVDPKHLQAKIRYLYMYMEFLQKEGESYGKKTDGSEQANPQGRRNSESESVLHDGPAESF